jgi:hypothetical protein
LNQNKEDIKAIAQRQWTLFKSKRCDAVDVTLVTQRRQRAASAIRAAADGRLLFLNYWHLPLKVYPARFLLA